MYYCGQSIIALTHYLIMLDLLPDDGWDQELAGARSSKFSALQDKLINDGLVAFSKGNMYVYLTNSNKWSVFVSAEVQRQICDITGNENASVNYLSASEPFIGTLEKHSRQVSAIPTSICIGTRRLAIALTKDGMTFTDCSGVASVSHNLDSRLNGFCVMPMSFTQIPSSWSLGGPNRIQRYLAVLFKDPVEFETIKWILGMAAVDPGSSSKFLLLYGPGGCGKSTTIEVIENIFKGCCGAISSDALTGKFTSMRPDTARTIASNRVVTAGDINTETSTINLHTVKEITGHDSVAIPPIKVRTRCTLVAGSNGLPDPEVQPTWFHSAISRRTVVVTMNVKTTLIPKREIPDSVEDCIDFLMLCTHSYLSNSTLMPISTRCVLYTLLGDGYNKVADRIQISSECTDQELVDANTQLDIYFGLPLHTLGELASNISMSAVTVLGTLYFVSNIRLIASLQD
jgi:energy-coupling factor transporter ATP-binding protein EcfA2